MTTTEAAEPITPADSGHGRPTAAPTIAFLGTGRMGGPMAANLARARRRGRSRHLRHAVTRPGAV